MFVQFNIGNDQQKVCTRSFYKCRCVFSPSLQLSGEPSNNLQKMKSIFALLSIGTLAAVSLAAAVPTAVSPTTVVPATVVPAGPGGPQYKIMFTDHVMIQTLTHGSNDFRQCYCLSNTLSITIYGKGGGLIQAYSSNNCSGGYQVIGSDSELGNAQWVNSISFGPGGVNTLKPGDCPKYY
ncbi:hypothetical protein BGZ65_004372 [Modicella reniformis]|uniref:Uncharacterized protein n=1 Tax=Modicella reniformis TaxID=1440133 RepID=A0A9P6SM48_9FUNG|nr:hypothetical protein BGZ65_004372 [Modicella reniformis]